MTGWSGFGGRRRDEDLAEELLEHIEEGAEQMVPSTSSRPEARQVLSPLATPLWFRRAAARSGNVPSLRLFLPI